MSLSDSDEQPHRPSGHRYWNESWYFNAFDPTSGLALAARVGMSPSRAASDGMVMLFFPDGNVGFIRTSGHLEEGEAAAIRSGPLSMTCGEPYRQWRLRYAGPVFAPSSGEPLRDFSRTMLVDLPRRAVDIDLSFTCRHAPFDFHGNMQRRPLPAARLIGKLRPGYLLRHLPLAGLKLRSLRAMSGARHYEQAVHAEGTVRIDEVSYDLRAIGQRDHSWGVRDMRVPTRWRWFSLHFGEALSLNCTRVEVLGWEAVGGYAFHNGRAEALADWVLDTEFDATGKWGRRLGLDVTTESGCRFLIDGEIRANLPVTLETEGLTAIVNEGLMRFRWGERETLGVSEFMEQLVP